MELILSFFMTTLFSSLSFVGLLGAIAQKLVFSADKRRFKKYSKSDSNWERFTAKTC